MYMGAFPHPDREMRVIKAKTKPFRIIAHHVLLMAAIPVVCAFIGTTQIGWNFWRRRVYNSRCLPLLRWRSCSTA